MGYRGVVEQNASDLSDFFQDAQDFAVATGELALALPGVRSAYKGFCRIAAGTPGGRALELMNVGNVCSPYLGEDGRTFGGPQPAGFVGGQCPGVAYNVTLLREGSFPSFETAATAIGGIGSAARRPSPTVGGRFEWFIPDGSQDGETVLNAAAAENETYTILSVERIDGQADDCGDPPPVFVPGDGYDGEEFGEPQVITGPDGKDREITVGPPTLDDGGGLSIPVTIDGLEINLGPGGGGSGGGGFVPGPTSTGPGSGVGPGDGDQPVPAGPDGSRCIAISVEVQNPPVSAGSVDDSAPPIRTYAAIGNVSLRLATDEGFAYWGPDVVLFQTRTVVSIPVEGFTVERYRVVLKPAMTATVTPIYRADS